MTLISNMAFCQEVNKDKVTIGIVMPVGGSGDLSFEWTATEGLARINQDIEGVNILTKEPMRIDVLKNCYEDFVSQGVKLIIGIGFFQEEALKEVAMEHPDVKFVIIDASVDLPNVTSVIFREDEGSFLAGCSASMVSKTGKIGFIGGMKSDIMDKFKKGYEDGAKYIKPDITIETKYIGDSEEAFSSPDIGKKIAKDMYDNNIDVIFAAAGGSGLGVIETARIRNKYCIGVDSDQDYIAPGNVITSMMKRVDNALYTTVRDYMDNKFKAGTVVMGLKDNGVSLTEFRYTQDLLTKEQFEKLEAIKKDIIDGKIVIK
jgi:basic membrane protein A